MERLPGSPACAGGVRPWPSPHLSTCIPQAARCTQMPQHRLFPSASRFRLDRRNADHGGARGCGAICHASAGRACLSDGAHRTSSSIWCSPKSSDAPGLVLYTLLDEDLIERLEDKCRELGLPCMSVLGPVLRLFQSYLGAEIDRIAPARSTCSTPNISSASTRSTTRCCMTTASTPKAWKMPTWCWSACRAPRRRRPRSISPIAASRPATCRWCRACRCRRSREAAPAAGGRAVRQSGAHRADPREPPARPERASR